MGYKERCNLYEKIEEKLGTPLIVYITSLKLGTNVKMSSDVIPFFIKQINTISKDVDDVSLMIISRGGDPMVAWRVIGLLRERFQKINVLIPYEAFSAATLIALGADEIFMHKYSNLGPVDPQITKAKRGPKITEEISFAAEDINHYLEFIQEDVGITNQRELQDALSHITSELGAQAIGFAKRSLNLTVDLGKKLLSLHMKDSAKVNAIIESLSKKFYHHGFALSRTEAEKIGLPIKNPDEQLEQLMWDVWEDFNRELKMDEPFQPIEILYEEKRDLFKPIPHIEIPTNLPLQLLNKAYQQIMNQISIYHVPPVKYEITNASLESRKLKVIHKSLLNISARRNVDLSISINITPIKSNWTVDKNE